MYRSNIECQPAGIFSGPLVVSMRPFAPPDAIRAIQITSRYPAVHEAPVHMGFPGAIGIGALAPEYGDAVEILPGELPVSWACDVTPQAVIASLGALGERDAGQLRLDGGRPDVGGGRTDTSVTPLNTLDETCVRYERTAITSTSSSSPG